MSDLRDLPDLARDVRERVVVPPYDVVSRRVRAQRRRTISGTLVAVVLIVAGLAVWQSMGTTRSLQPALPPSTPSPIPPTDASQWRAVVDGTQAHPFEVSGNDDGSIAVVWRALEPGGPTFALVIRASVGTVHGFRLDSPVTLTPVEGGWVGVSLSRGWLIGNDGTWTDLGEPGEARLPRLGDTLVNGQSERWLYSSVDRAWATYPASPVEVEDDYLTPSGHQVTCDVSRAGVKVWRGSSVRYAGDPAGAVSCAIFGHGDRVVVAMTGDAPDGSIPVVGLVRSDDSGWSWHEFAVPQGVDFASLSIGIDGPIYLTSTDGRLVVTQPDGTQSVAPGEHGVGFVTDDRVCALAYGQSKGPLSCSDDRGQTWTETPLPGLE